MPALQHIYLTAHGKFNSGVWLGEAAQFGLRLTIAETGAMPDKGSLFDVPLNGDVATDQGITAGTNGSLTRTWTARRGPVGSTENCDAGFQIDLAEDTHAFLTAVKGYQHSTFQWTGVKMAPVDALGKTVGTSSVYNFTTPIQGTSSQMMPPQIAVAISTRANILGRRGRGRIYLPAVGSTYDTSGQITAAANTALRAAFVSYLNALQNLPGTPDYLPLLTIMSAGSTVGVRPSQVRVGNRHDTIRSRREQVPETYTTTEL